MVRHDFYATDDEIEDVRSEIVEVLQECVGDVQLGLLEDEMGLPTATEMTEDLMHGAEFDRPVPVPKSVRNRLLRLAKTIDATVDQAPEMGHATELWRLELVWAGDTDGYGDAASLHSFLGVTGHETLERTYLETLREFMSGLARDIQIHRGPAVPTGNLETALANVATQLHDVGLEETATKLAAVMTKQSPGLRM